MKPFVLTLSLLALALPAWADDSLNLNQEGVYDVQGTSPEFQPDRLVIMDTTGTGSWVAAFSNSVSGTVIYTFNNLTLKDSQIVGTSSDPNTPRSVQILIDPQIGAVTGSIRDSRIPNGADFKGTRKVSTAVLLASSPSAGQGCASSPAGSFVGGLDNAAGTLTITSVDSTHYAASFVSNGAAPFTADFNVQYAQTQGLLQLIHQNADGTFLKVALICGNHGSAWTGIGFSFLGGANYPVNFEVKP